MSNVDGVCQGWDCLLIMLLVVVLLGTCSLQRRTRAIFASRYADCGEDVTCDRLYTQLPRGLYSRTVVINHPQICPTR